MKPYHYDCECSPFFVCWRLHQHQQWGDQQRKASVLSLVLGRNFPTTQEPLEGRLYKNILQHIKEFTQRQTTQHGPDKADPVQRWARSSCLHGQGSRCRSSSTCSTDTHMSHRRWEFVEARDIKWSPWQCGVGSMHKYAFIMCCRWNLEYIFTCSRANVHSSTGRRKRPMAGWRPAVAGLDVTCPPRIGAIPSMSCTFWGG